MPFQLGPRSVKELEGVHPQLVQAVELTMERTLQDFAVHDGLRTQAEQDEYLRSGASTVKFSKHQTQPDGFGHAVDLVPYINGKLRWEMAPIIQITSVLRTVCVELDLGLTWGACWDRDLRDLSDNPDLLDDDIEAYAARRRALGKKPFIDGPHFELRV